MITAMQQPNVPNWDEIAPIWNRIRPFYDDEVNTAVASLVKDPEFMATLKLFPPEKASCLLESFGKMHSIKEVNNGIYAPALTELLKQTTFSYDLSGTSSIKNYPAVTFISNHRDIILDVAILNLLLFQAGFTMARMAIGDNLLDKEWIKTLVKLAGAVMVERSLSPKAFIESSKVLSLFINHSVVTEKQSLWIAQREGRAKDSNDRTQPALLKMLANAGGGTLRENLLKKNIIPMTISYEYDPCDYLKARELLAKADGEAYTKQPGEDRNSMAQGIMGNKGRVHINLGTPLEILIKKTTDPILQASNTIYNNEWFSRVATLVDNEIHRRYRFYPGNYIALDLLTNSKAGQTLGHYSLQESNDFKQYVNERVQLAQPTNNAEAEKLRNLIMVQYATPLKNYLSLTQTIATPDPTSEP